MKYFRLLVCTLLGAVLAVNICAETSGSYIFNYEDKNITVSFDSSLDEKTCNEISDRLIYGSSEAKPSAISFCWLFGHDLTTSTVTEIKHKAKPKSPRCLQERHAITTCSKCDYMEDEIVSSVYIACHPED